MGSKSEKAALGGGQRPSKAMTGTRAESKRGVNVTRSKLKPGT